MRKLNQSFRFTVLLVLTIISFQNCKTLKKDCPSCAVASDDFATLTFDSSLGFQKNSANIWYVDVFKKNYDYAELSNPDIFDFKLLRSSIENNLHCKIKIDDSIICYVLYLDNQIRIKKTLSASDINGIGIYTYNSNKFYHYLFKKESINNSGLKEIFELQSIVDGINISLIHKMMKEIISPYEAPSTSFLIPNSTNFNLLKNAKYSFDQLQKKVSTYISNKQGSTLRTEPAFENIYDDVAGEALCYPPCSYKSFSSCYKREVEPGGTCRGSFCALKRAYHAIVVANFWKNNDSVDITIQPSSLYYFRDSTLVKSELGRRYIDNYYYLSGVFQNNFNLETSLKVLRVMPIVYTIIEGIKNGNPETTLYNTDSANELISIIDYFKSLTTDQTVINELDSIIRDIQNYANRPVSEVRSALNI
jgi:hypothetical protein